jgi:hypothetical protein
MKLGQPGFRSRTQERENDQPRTADQAQLEADDVPVTAQGRQTIEAEEAVDTHPD